MKSAALEAAGSRAPEAVAGRPVARPPPGSAELPGAARRVLRRHRGGELGHCQGVTLTMLRRQAHEFVEELAWLGLGLRLGLGIG